MAYNRPAYLRRTLAALLAARGARRELITVSHVPPFSPLPPPPPTPPRARLAAQCAPQSAPPRTRSSRLDDFHALLKWVLLGASATPPRRCVFFLSTSCAHLYGVRDTACPISTG